MKEKFFSREFLRFSTAGGILIVTDMTHPISRNFAPCIILSINASARFWLFESSRRQQKVNRNKINFQWILFYKINWNGFFFLLFFVLFSGSFQIIEFKPRRCIYVFVPQFVWIICQLRYKLVVKNNKSANEKCVECSKLQKNNPSHVYRC